MMPEVDRALETNDAIAELAALKRSLDCQARELVDGMKVIAARIELDIAMTTDEKGKRLYSNAGMRRAERTLRLDADTEYQGLKQNLRLIDQKRGEIVIEHDRLVNQRQILKLALAAARVDFPIGPG